MKNVSYTYTKLHHFSDAKIIYLYKDIASVFMNWLKVKATIISTASSFKLCINYGI